MFRSLFAVLVLVLSSQSIWAQDKAKPADKKAAEDPDQLILKLRRASYPQPYNERAVLTIENASPLQMVMNRKTKRDGGAKITFLATIKNTGTQDFEFSPQDFYIEVLDEKGVEIPKNRVDWNGLQHGDTAIYPIKSGEKNYKPISITFADDDIKEGAKYFVVVAYIHLYKEPAPAFDWIVGMKPIVAEKSAEETKAGK